MTVTASLLTGKRVLIVEDEALVAMLLEGLLEEYGCDVVGPCSTLQSALDVVRTQTFDLAVLDVNLRGLTMSCQTRDGQARRRADHPARSRSAPARR
jgi:CheY-like chemotaxis protein